LRGVSYTKDGKTEVGVIAQEVEEVVPEVVQTNEAGMKSVAYGNLVGVLIESVKELKAEIEDLRSQLNSKNGDE
jgi:ribonuclease PH